MTWRDWSIALGLSRGDADSHVLVVVVVASCWSCWRCCCCCGGCRGRDSLGGEMFLLRCLEVKMPLR